LSFNTCLSTPTKGVFRTGTQQSSPNANNQKQKSFFAHFLGDLKALVL
jgi:hypothetical protein